MARKRREHDRLIANYSKVRQARQEDSDDDADADDGAATSGLAALRRVAVAVPKAAVVRRPPSLPVPFFGPDANVGCVVVQSRKRMSKAARAKLKKQQQRGKQQAGGSTMYHTATSKADRRAYKRETEKSQFISSEQPDALKEVCTCCCARMSVSTEVLVLSWRV